MARRVLIIADDLTGAADAAVAFATQGATSLVVWGETLGDACARADVIAYNADTRGLTASSAAQRNVAWLSRHDGADALLFKKIDSTLRGQPAAEIAALLAALRARDGHAFAVLAPAFPATGRTTRNGRIYVHDQPLETTQLWQHEHTYDSAELPAMLASAGMQGLVLSLDTVRSADASREALAAVAARGEVAVCDAMTQADLDAVAAASVAQSANVLLIGSAGLAHGLASLAHAAAADEPAAIAPPGPTGMLIAVGSLAAASRAAARTLAQRPGVHYVSVTSEVLLTDDRAAQRAIATRIAAALAGGEEVVVELQLTAAELVHSARLATAFGMLIGPLAAIASALVATGGDTAAALLDHCGVTALRLIAELEAGVCLAETQGALRLPIVTKAGAFGDPQTLVRIVERLRSLRQVE